MINARQQTVNNNRAILIEIQNAINEYLNKKLKDIQEKLSYVDLFSYLVLPGAEIEKRNSEINRIRMLIKQHLYDNKECLSEEAITEIRTIVAAYLLKNKFSHKRERRYKREALSDGDNNNTIKKRSNSFIIEYNESSDNESQANDQSKSKISYPQAILLSKMAADNFFMKLAGIVSPWSVPDYRKILLRLSSDANQRNNIEIISPANKDKLANKDKKTQSYHSNDIIIFDGHYAVTIEAVKHHIMETQSLTYPIEVKEADAVQHYAPITNDDIVGLLRYYPDVYDLIHEIKNKNAKLSNDDEYERELFLYHPKHELFIDENNYCYFLAEIVGAIKFSISLERTKYNRLLVCCDRGFGSEDIIKLRHRLNVVDADYFITLNGYCFAMQELIKLFIGYKKLINPIRNRLFDSIDIIEFKKRIENHPNYQNLYFITEAGEFFSIDTIAAVNKTTSNRFIYKPGVRGEAGDKFKESDKETLLAVHGFLAVGHKAKKKFCALNISANTLKQLRVLVVNMLNAQEINLVSGMQLKNGSISQEGLDSFKIYCDLLGTKEHTALYDYWIHSMTNIAICTIKPSIKIAGFNANCFGTLLLQPSEMCMHTKAIAVLTMLYQLNPKLTANDFLEFIEADKLATRSYLRSIITEILTYIRIKLNADKDYLQSLSATGKSEEDSSSSDSQDQNECGMTRISLRLSNLSQSD